MLSGDQHRVARLAVVGGDRHAGAGPVRADQPAHRLRSHQRLIHQRNHHRADPVGAVGAEAVVALLAGAGGILQAESGQRRTQGRSHPGSPDRIVYSIYAFEAEIRGTSDHEYGIGAAGTKQRHAALGERLTTQFDQRLRPAEPRPFPGGEQDPGDPRQHGPSVRRPLPGVSGESSPPRIPPQASDRELPFDLSRVLTHMSRTMSISCPDMRLLSSVTA